jgi:hypothetical protein
MSQELVFRDLIPKGVVMPVWMEVLLNVLGYAGFIGVATFNRSPDRVQAPGVPCEGRVS